jgi:hypothetical protein
MSTLTRKDGVQFVIQAYRELLTHTKKVVLAQHIRTLAEQQGQFVRLFKNDTNQYEAVLSKEGGYLLGESVKHYFYQAKNLIFCETLENSHKLLLVIIKKGNVFLDTLITPNELRNELTPFFTDNEPFQIYTSGDVPIEAFEFPENLILSFEEIDEPLLQRLPTLPSLQLLPLQSALKNEGLHRKIYISPALISAIAVPVLIVGLIITFHSSDKPMSLSKHVRIIDNPYKVFNNALMTASPIDQISGLTQQINIILNIPGWNVHHIIFSNGHLRAKLQKKGGDLQSLEQWSIDNNYRLILDNNSGELVTTLFLQSRERPKHTYISQKCVEVIIDHFNHLFPNGTTHIGKISKIDSSAKRTQLTLSAQDASPTGLLLLGNALNTLPISIDSIDLKLTKNSINSTIHLSVWGK